VRDKLGREATTSKTLPCLTSCAAPAISTLAFPRALEPYPVPPTLFAPVPLTTTHNCVNDRQVPFVAEVQHAMSTPCALMRLPCVATGKAG